MDIYFFNEKGEKSPIQKFIDSLPIAEQARVLEVIDEIERNGFQAVRVIFKHLESKLWEIKFRSKNSSYRAFYIVIEKNSMVWLHAFSKKSQKTPLKELRIAKKRMKELLK